MGFDATSGTPSGGCRPGMVRLRDYLFARFGGWDLGCFNPASMGGYSLHAEGRAQDFAFNANQPDERAAGDALFRWAVEHAAEIGLQEMLWRGAIWYYPRKDTEHGWGDFQLEGVYGPVQQADHMSHVHLGVDRNAAEHWQPDWITDAPTPPAPEEHRMFIVQSRETGVQSLYTALGATANIDETFANELAMAGVPRYNVPGKVADDLNLIHIAHHLALVKELSGLGGVTVDYELAAGKVADVLAKRLKD